VLAGAFTIFNFLTYGTTAVVARASGAGEQERAARLAAQALWLSLGIGALVLVTCEALAGPLLQGLGAHGKSGDYAATYFRIAAIGLPAALVIMLMPFSFSITNGIGFGFIAYVLIRLAQGRTRDVHPLMWVVSGAFTLYFLVPLLQDHLSWI